MRTITETDLEAAVVWRRRGGFPGELLDADVESARELLSGTPEAHAVLVVLGAEELCWVDGDAVERVTVARADELPDAVRETGYELGTGDGATLLGLPVSWKLLRFACPVCGTTIGLARYPKQPPRCPRDDVPFELQPGDP